MNICAVNKCLVNFCEATNRGKPIVMCFGAYSSFFFFFLTWLFGPDCSVRVGVGGLEMNLVPMWSSLLGLIC